MMKRIYMVLLLFIVLLSSGSVSAVDDELYYRLGGGLPIGQGATNRANTLDIGGGITWNTDLTCGNFDMGTSISNQLNGVTGAFQTLMGNVIQTAQGVVASLPALLIQRLNPALYDLLQNGVLQASEEFHLADLNCQSIVDEMGKTVSNEGWDGLAQAGWWSRDANTAGTDILDTQTNAETQGLDGGVTWVEGNQAGGAGQPSVLINEDTAVAGYNLLLQRSPGDTSTVSTGPCAGAAICTVWTTPAQAAGWVTDVLGDTEIKTCQGCNKITTHAGMGMQRKYEQEKLTIQTNMQNLVFSSNIPNQTTLDSLQGAEGFRVTRQVIEAIREEEEPAAMVERLSGELAISRTLEYALMARRMMLAGMKEPNIANNELAQEALRHAAEELNGEIENMVFEIDVRAKVASNTTVHLLQRARQRNTVPVMEPSPPQTIREGATN